MEKRHQPPLPLSKTRVLSDANNGSSTSAVSSSRNLTTNGVTRRLLLPRTYKRKTRHHDNSYHNHHHSNSTKTSRRREQSSKRFRNGQSNQPQQFNGGRYSESMNPRMINNPMSPAWLYSYPPYSFTQVQGHYGKIRSESSNSSDTTSSRVYATTSSGSGGTDRTNNEVKDWSNVDGMILHTAVAAYASQMDPDTSSNEVDVEKLDWELIAKHFQKQNAVSCYHYWKTLNPETSLLKTPQGVFYIHNNVSEDSSERIGPFTTSSGEFSATQLSRKRRKKRVKAPWSEAEEKKIDQLQQELGNKWTKIAQQLGTERTGNDVKNYWHSAKDKIIASRFLRQQKNGVAVTATES